MSSSWSSPARSSFPPPSSGSSPRTTPRSSSAGSWPRRPTGRRPTPPTKSSRSGATSRSSRTSCAIPGGSSSPTSSGSRTCRASTGAGTRSWPSSMPSSTGPRTPSNTRSANSNSAGAWPPSRSGLDGWPRPSRSGAYSPEGVRFFGSLPAGRQPGIRRLRPRPGFPKANARRRPLRASPFRGPRSRRRQQKGRPPGAFPGRSRRLPP